MMLNYNVTFALCRITLIDLKHTCVKRCKAKKYWGETILSPQYLQKYWGKCPRCPYRVRACDVCHLQCRHQWLGHYNISSSAIK